jgi:hypothetical protein
MPIVFDAAAGKVYHHVRRDTETNNYAPDVAVNFGLNFDASFFDVSGGKVAFFDIGLGATIMDRGFILEMYGKVDAANIMKENDKGELKLQKSLISGSGLYTINSIDGTFIGHSNVHTNTQPLICCGGDFDIAITRNGFNFALGTRQQPIMLDVLCRNRPQLAGWFALSNIGLDMGAFIDIDINLETGWIGGGCTKIKPWMRFMFKSGFSAEVFWDPFKIAEASVWFDVYAGVGIKYYFCLKSGNFIIADVGLGGYLKYAADPESILSGNLHGGVHVLGVGFIVSMYAEVKL